MEIKIKDNVVLGKCAVDVIKVLSQHDILQNEVQQVFDIVKEWLGYSIITDDVIHFLQDTQDLHK